MNQLVHVVVADHDPARPTPDCRNSSAAERPNILLAIADDASYPHMGAYGCTWVRTPAFDRVAREGLLFTRAYTPNAKCAPSRACILTGRNSWQLKAACNHIPYFPAEFPTYAEVLGQHGYFVGMTVKGWSPGVAQDAQGQDRLMAGRPFNGRTTPTTHSPHRRGGLRREFRRFPGGRAARHAVVLLVWERRAASGLRNTAAERPKGTSPCPTSTGSPACWPDNETVRNDSAGLCASRSSTSTVIWPRCCSCSNNAANWTTRWSSSPPTTGCRFRA